MNHKELMEIETLDRVVWQMKKDGSTLDSLDESTVKKFKKLTVNQIYQLLCQSCKSLGYELDNENLYYLMNDRRIILVLATAGSGKTFSICVKLIRKILLQGLNPNRVCVLSFTRKSVNDIKERIVSTMRGFNLECRRFDIYLDSTEIPNVRSLNSLTYNIVDQFSSKFGMASLKIADDSTVKEIMSRVIKSKAKDSGAFKAQDSMVGDMVSLYNLLNEELKEVEEYKNHSYLTNNGFTVEIVDDMVKSFRNLLKISGQITHSDTGRMILELADKDEEFRNTVAGFYDLVVVDEIQDVSECTFQIIKLLVGDKNELWGVGDGDQSIYKFKGSRPNNCELFAENYEEAVTCHLTLNRRCGDNILEMGRMVLSNIPTRKGELPRALKEGGKVTHHYYKSPVAPIQDLINELVKVDKRELGEYCITFRKNFSAFYIVNLMLEAGIPFQIRDDFSPGEDLLSRTMKDAMALLRSPSNIPLITRTMYKITGISKIPPLAMVNKVLRKNLSQRDLYNPDLIELYYDECMELADCDYFYELPVEYYGTKGSDKVIEEQLEVLEELSRKVKRGNSMLEIIPELKDIVDKNYWSFTGKYVNFPIELEEMIIKDMTRDMTYVEYRHMKNQQEERIKKHIARGMGVQLSTMHTLKGLEFREVHVIELDSKNMPMVNTNGSDKEILEDIYEEMRLLYVAITRAKEELHMYWSEQEPSSFLPIVEDYNNKMGQVMGSNNSLVAGFEEYQELDEIVLDSEFELELDIPEVDLILTEDTTEDLILNEGTEDLTLIEDTTEDLIIEESTEDLIITEDTVEDLILDDSNEDLNLEDSTEDLILDDSKEDLILDDSNEDLITADSAEEETKSTELKVNERVSKLLNKMITAKEVSTLPVYKSEEIDEEELNLLHPREDFVEIKNGEELRSILGLICKEIM